MSETLLTSSSIKLFGRILYDLIYKYDQNTVNVGANNFLQSQLKYAIPPVAFTGAVAPSDNKITGVATPAALANLIPGMVVTGPAGVLSGNTSIVRIDSANAIVYVLPLTLAAAAGGSAFSANISANFARIYAFAFEGALYTMPKPVILLVHGAGLPVDGSGSGYRTTTDQSGVIAREWEFASPTNQDLRYWEYEKGDFSLRLEPEAGPLEQILLQAVARSGADRADRAGAGLEVRSGAGLSGAGVSGAGVSGAGVSGAGLSGAGLRR